MFNDKHEPDNKNNSDDDIDFLNHELSWSNETLFADKNDFNGEQNYTNDDLFKPVNFLSLMENTDTSDAGIVTFSKPNKPIELIAEAGTYTTKPLLPNPGVEILEERLRQGLGEEKNLVMTSKVLMHNILEESKLYRSTEVIKKLLKSISGNGVDCIPVYSYKNRTEFAVSENGTSTKLRLEIESDRAYINGLSHRFGSSSLI